MGQPCPCQDHPSKASSSPETTFGKEHPAKLRIYAGLFTQHSAGKKALLGEEATEQSISMAGMPVYSRYATFGKKIKKIPFEVRSPAKNIAMSLAIYPYPFSVNKESVYTKNKRFFFLSDLAILLQAKLQLKQEHRTGPLL